MAQPLGYPLHISANGSYAPAQANSKILLTVTVNALGSGGNRLTVYNGTDATGVVVAIIDVESALGSFLYDIVCTAGLFFVLATGVAADLTITTY